MKNTPTKTQQLEKEEEIDAKKGDEEVDNLIDPAEEELKRLTESCLELDTKIKRLQKRNILFLIFPIVMIIRAIFKALDHHYQEQWILEL